MASGKFQVLPNVFSSSDLRGRVLSPSLGLSCLREFSRVRCELPEFPLSLLSDAVRPQLGNCLVNSPLATLTQVTVQVRAGFAPVSLAREALNLFMPLARGPKQACNRCASIHAMQRKGKRGRAREEEVLEGTQVFISSCPRC